MEADDFADHPAVELGPGFKRVELNTDIDDLLGDRPFLVYCNQLQVLAHTFIDRKCSVKGYNEEVVVTSEVASSALYMKWIRLHFVSATTYICGLKLYLQNLSFPKVKYQDNLYTCTSMLYGLKFLSIALFQLRHIRVSTLVVYIWLSIENVECLEYDLSFKISIGILLNL
jgi:hypothetical protein